MPIFKKSISEKLNLDLMKFADKEKAKQEELYLRKDVSRDLSNSIVIGLTTGSAMSLVVGSMIAHVTNTIPLDVVHSNIQLAIIPASIALAVTPIMKLYDKVKAGECKFSGKKIVENNDYEYDYQDLSLFKNRIASKIENPLKDDKSPYMTAKEIRKAGRDNLYHSFAAGVTSTMIIGSVGSLVAGQIDPNALNSIINVSPYGAAFFAVAPVLNLIEKCKENYDKATFSLRNNAALAHEIDNRMNNNAFVAPMIEAKKLDITMPILPKIDFELPAKLPEVPMNQDGLMSSDDLKVLSNAIKSKYAALLPKKPENVNSPEYFTAVESEINLLIQNSNVNIAMPDEHKIVIPMKKDDLKKPFFIDAITQKIENPQRVSETITSDLNKADLLKFVTKINETYKPLPEPTTRQIPKEVFIFEEPELIDMPVSGISAKQASTTELNINIPKELEGLKASKADDILPVLEIQDNGFKVKEGDHIKQFFKDQILKQQALNNPKPENLVANKQDRVKSRMTV